MNEYDSGKMFDVLKAHGGAVKVETPEEADIILLNTCSVREKAQEKVFSDIGRLRPLKAINPNLIIGVGGCVASQEGKAIVKRMPSVDLVFGPQTLHRLPQMLAQRLAEKKPVVDISFPEIEKFDQLPKPHADGVSAYVTIMEGCSKYCSFCVVPYTRGEEISRPFDDVLAEVYQLAEQGVREITLLGQNVNDYRGLMHTGEIADLALLIHYLAAIDNILRIRFTTSHPAAFSDSLIEVYANEPKLVNHLHLPVQSGSDRILAAMKRNYTVLEFKSKIKKLRAVRPDICISSDFIIGYPGETEKDFMATMNLIHDIGFDHSYSFIYSPRPGTPAANLPDDVPLEVKKERLAILQDRIQLKAQEISQNMLGSLQTILIAAQSKNDANDVMGRTENNRSTYMAAEINGMPVALENLIGKMAEVRITEKFPNSLRGEIVEILN